MDTTGLPKSYALELLRRTGFNMEQAIEMLFEQGPNAYMGGGSNQFAEKQKKQKQQIEKVFDKYKQDKDSIGIDGTLEYLNDLGLNPEDETVLALCMELKAPAEGQFDRTGFVSGWQRQMVGSFQEMQKKVQEMKLKMKEDDKYFTSVYRFTFTYNLAEGVRTLPLDTAFPLWQLLLEKRYFCLNKWFEFLSTEYKNKSVSKDTWNMIWDFAKFHKQDEKLENYDEEASWPTIIDEYVEWLKPQL